MVVVGNGHTITFTCILSPTDPQSTSLCLSARCVRRSPKRAGLVMRFGTHSKQIEISPYKAYKREVSLVTSARELPQGVTFGRNCLYALRHTVRFGFDGSVRSRYVLVSTSRVLHAQPCRSSHIVAYMTSICKPS